MTFMIFGDIRRTQLLSIPSIQIVISIRTNISAEAVNDFFSISPSRILLRKVVFVLALGKHM